MLPPPPSWAPASRVRQVLGLGVTLGRALLGTGLRVPGGRETERQSGGRAASELRGAPPSLCRVLTAGRGGLPWAGRPAQGEARQGEAARLPCEEGAGVGRCGAVRVSRCEVCAEKSSTWWVVPAVLGSRPPMPPPLPVTASSDRHPRLPSEGPRGRVGPPGVWGPGSPRFRTLDRVTPASPLRAGSHKRGLRGGSGTGSAPPSP